MGTRFVIGRSGSGKSRFLLDRLVEHLRLDPLMQSAIVLVPKQATFVTQRRIATDSRLGGFVNVRVIAPDDLAELALIEAGHADGMPLNASARALILTHLLRAHAGELIHLGRSASQAGTAVAIDETFSEFERAGRDLCEIDDILQAHQEGNTTAQQALVHKLDDLCRLYTLYQQYLTDHGFDPYRRQLNAPQAIRECALVKKALVLIDDFHDFSAYERQLILALAGTAERTLIALTFDPDSPLVGNPHYLPGELDVFHRTELTYRKLYFTLNQAGVAIEPPELCRRTNSFISPALATIERNFDARHLMPVGSSADVRLIEAADPADEAEAAARQIKAWLAEGLRLRDVCVFARTLEAYEPHISNAFAEHGVSYFVDRRRDARHHPLVRTIVALCQIVLTRWSPESVIEMLRGGLTPIDQQHADALEDYLRQHAIPPALWQTNETWSFERRAHNEEESAERSLFTADDLRHVAATRDTLRAAIGPVGRPAWAVTEQPVGQLVRDLFEVMARFNIKAQVERMVAAAAEGSEVEQREEHEQVWTSVVELADQLVELLGDVPMAGAAFAAMVQAQLNELQLAITPPTLDQVLVGTPDRTRTHEARAMIVLGLNAGQFPMTVNEKPVLNDRDRVLLEQVGVEVEPPSQRAILNERFLGYIALTRATEKLTLIRTRADAAGNGAQPSLFWQMVHRTLPRNVIEHAPAGPAAIATPRQLVTQLLHWARLPADAQATDTASTALYQWAVETPTPAVAVVRDQAWPALSYANAPALLPDVRARIFPSPLAGSVSRFESFAACPFQHFARYGLVLRQLPEPDITAADLGSLYHAVLEKLIRRVIQEQFPFATTDQLGEQQIAEIARAVGEQLRHQLFLSSARNRYTLSRLERVVARLLRAQQFASGRGQFQPGYTELEFSEHGDLPPLELHTPGGSHLRLSGKIDRVDLNAARQQYVVIDYKLSGDQLDLGYVAHGLKLQLLTYLLVLESHGPCLSGRPLTPAAAVYARLLRSYDSSDDPANEPGSHEPSFHARSEFRGLINAEHAEQLDREIYAPSTPSLYSVKRTKEGKLYEKGNDAVELEEFQSLIAHVHQTIVALADQIIGGEIGVLPYMVGTNTPCSTCPFIRVCRFDRLINHYRVLPKMSRREALERIIHQQGADE